MLTLEDGTKVRITHYRISNEEAEQLVRTHSRLRDADAVGRSIYALRKAGVPIGTMSNRGGMTVAEVIRGDEVVATGEACCRPDEAFSHKIGRDVAVGRALKTLREAAVH